jgi:hypothetical protein
VAEWILLQQLGQKLELRLARVLDLRGHDLRGGGDCVQPGLDRAQQAAWVPVELRMEVPGNWNGWCEQAGLPAQVDLPAQAEAEQKFPMRCSRPRKPCRVPVPRRNTLAAEAEERVGRMGQRVSFCDAASGRASIYACKVFNTEERAGSIDQPCVNHNR